MELLYITVHQSFMGCYIWDKQLSRNKYNSWNKPTIAFKTSKLTKLWAKPIKVVKF